MILKVIECLILMVAVVICLDSLRLLPSDRYLHPADKALLGALFLVGLIGSVGGIVWLVAS